MTPWQLWYMLNLRHNVTLSTCSWVKVLQEELRLAQEQVQTSVADEVNAAPPTEVL